MKLAVHLRHIFLLLLILIAFSSCSGRIDGVIRQEEGPGGIAGAGFSLDITLGTRMASLIRTLSEVMTGLPANGPILNAGLIGKSIAAAPGVSQVALKNPRAVTIAGSISVANLSEFLAVPSGIAGASGESLVFKYDPKGRLLISLDRNSGPLILTMLSPEVNQYLSALLAPVATGEPVSKSEYLSLVAAIYGKPIADEIAASSIRIALEFPGTITGIRGGTARGSQAEFTIPLPDLLVLEQPLSYEISWYQ